MSNKKLPLSSLKVVRQKAVYAVVNEGLTQCKAAKLFGFSTTSMNKYIKEYNLHGEGSFSYKKRGIKPLSNRYLSQSQSKELVETLLNHGPNEIGLEYTLWNSKVIQAFIKKTFSIHYSGRGIRNLMNRLGFSCQKPIKQAYQRNLEAVTTWLNETYPKIKIRAMRERARIYWGDEMVIQSTDNRGRCYGLVGKTPLIKQTGSRFKVNMLAAISPQGFMNWMVFENNCDSKKFIEFLGRMRRQIKQKIFLIVDNHRIHHSKKVNDYIEKYKNDIELFLPSYCPDLNPQELVNQDVKANSHNFKAIKSLNDLTINIRFYLTKIQFNSTKIMSFFKKKETCYAAWNNINILMPE